MRLQSRGRTGSGSVGVRRWASLTRDHLFLDLIVRSRGRASSMTRLRVMHAHTLRVVAQRTHTCASSADVLSPRLQVLRRLRCGALRRRLLENLVADVARSRLLWVVGEHFLVTTADSINILSRGPCRLHLRSMMELLTTSSEVVVAAELV